MVKRGKPSPLFLYHSTRKCLEKRIASEEAKIALLADEVLTFLQMNQLYLVPSAGLFLCNRIFTSAFFIKKHVMPNPTIIAAKPSSSSFHTGLANLHKHLVLQIRYCLYKLLPYFYQSLDLKFFLL